ncbi:hypothetical protein JTE90_005737 [Oedothorax gibbosus]|uniref:G-protein coupled receptors family 1 profile domain-containing protein n=1 Tax=Oedothorax gibbosus TaxID=931172 RepID=A0AAV6UT33_9ARAC|nr:hypothetical protein JTE90_005737 [Oedothorax gibbosus]
MTDNASISNATLGTPSLPDISLFEFATEGAALSLLCVIGILGNIVSLAILSRPEMRSPVNCGLQGLAFFDTVVLISSVTMLGLHKLGYKLDILRSYTFDAFPFVVLVAYPVGLIAQTGSVWMTVGVTVERYVAVCHPLRARFLCTHRRARLCTVAVAVLAIAYNAPRFLEIQLVRVAPGQYVAKPSQFRMNRLYYKVYYIWLYLFVMYFIPFLTLAVLNCCIWRAVRNASANRQHLTQRQQKELGLATMLICVVVVFFVCNALALLVNVMELFDMYQPALVRVSNLLVTLNSSVNFLVYCIFGQKFRRMFLEMFLKCTRRSRAPRSIRSYYSSSVRTETLRSVVASSPSCHKTRTSNGNCAQLSSL